MMLMQLHWERKFTEKAELFWGAGWGEEHDELTQQGLL